LLVRSLRRFGGSLCDMQVHSFAPRPGRGISRETAAEFEALGVVHDERPLNNTHPDYALANKVRVCATAERELDAEVLVFADSDQLFFGEPNALRLGADEDAAVQPEPMRWIGAGSPDHAEYSIWQALLERHGIDSPVFTRTLIGDERIFGWWNSGLVAVRRRAGIFGRWQEIFDTNWNEEIWPNEWEYLFFTEQLSFGLALMASRARVRRLPIEYNYNVTIHDRLPPPLQRHALEEITTIHYHKLLGKASWRDPFARPRSFRPKGERLEWLCEEMRSLDLGRPTGLRGLFARVGRKLSEAAHAEAQTGRGLPVWRVLNKMFAIGGGENGAVE